MSKFNKILIVYSEKLSKTHIESLNKVKQKLEGRDYIFLRADRILEKYFEDIDLVITVGGDGTFIRAASFIKEKLIVGINSEPEYSEGALLSLKDDELYILDEILNGKYKIQKKIRIKIKINGKEIQNLALNEVYFGVSNQFHTSHYIISYKNAKEEQRSSGVLVATPSGSTAWYKSARGRPFKGNKLKFIVREPYFGSRVFNPKLLKGEIEKGEKIEFISKRHDNSVVTLDSNYTYRLERGDKVEMEMSEFPLKVLLRKRAN
nr:hypothetical protein [Nanoarchaeum sp.]